MLLCLNENPGARFLFNDITLRISGAFLCKHHNNLTVG